MTTPPARSSRRFDLTNVNEFANQRLTDPDLKNYAQKVNQFFRGQIQSYPPAQQKDLWNNFNFHNQLINRKFEGVRIEQVTPSGLDNFLKFLTLYEKGVLQQAIKSNYKTVFEVLEENKDSLTNYRERVLPECENFVEKHYLDQSDFKISPSVDAMSYLNIQNLKKHRLFSDVINQDTLDLYLLERDISISSFENFLFGQLVDRILYNLGLKEPDRSKARKAFISDPSWSTKVSKFLLFTGRLDLTPADIKLKSLEDPTYRDYIEKQFAAYQNRLNILAQGPNASEKQNFMQAQLDDLLQDEKKVTVKKSQGSSKQSPKPLPLKEPPAATATRRADPNNLPALKKEALAQPKPVRKSDYNSPEWKTVASPAKAEKTLSPTKILEKMRACDLPKIHPRVKRWEFVTNLESIQGFSDCLIENGLKKNIQRYKEQNETNLTIQLARHLVPNELARILNSRDFKERYCYINESNHYFKIRLTVGGLLDEETIVSYGLDSDNALFHFFIHPSKEVEWNQKLSEVAQNLDPSLPESYTPQSMNFVPEISLQENSNATAPTIMVTQKHPLLPSDIRLEIFPRAT